MRGNEEAGGEWGDEELEFETRSMLKKSSKEEGKARAEDGGWRGESTSIVVVGCRLSVVGGCIRVWLRCCES